MVYYVDKIQELETELGRLRSLRSSDKAEKANSAILAKEKGGGHLAPHFPLETSSVGSGHKIHRIQIRLEPYPTFTLYLRHLPVAVVQKSTIQNLLNNFQTFDKKNSKNKNSDEISLNPDQDTDSDPYLPNW